jgi:hypothetical protein
MIAGRKHGGRRLDFAPSERFLKLAAPHKKFGKVRYCPGGNRQQQLD